MPHNRVRRKRLVDESGAFVGFGEPEPMPEPPLDPLFCRKKTLPSGKVIVELQHLEVESAYRQARYPKETANQVEQLLMSEDKVRRLAEQVSSVAK